MSGMTNHNRYRALDLFSRYEILRNLIRTELGDEVLTRFDYETNELLLDAPPPSMDAELVVVQDLSDIEDDDDTFDRDEVIAARTTFSWIVRFEVSGTWVADGFDLDHQRALDMLSHNLGYANIGTELNARVIAAPPPELIAKTQGQGTVAAPIDYDAEREAWVNSGGIALPEE